MTNHNGLEMMQKIKKAFKNVEHPRSKLGDYDIDGWRFKEWKDVTPGDINATSLIFFSHKALHYFLPAILIVSLQWPEQLDHFRIVEDLGRYTGKSLSKPKDDFCKMFSKRQIQIILEYLERYPEFFPSPDITHLPESLRRRAEQRYQDQTQILHDAANYWRECYG